MADISMNYQAVGELEKKAAFLQNGLSEMIQKLEELYDEVQDRWDGKAKTDFAAKMESVLPKMEAISDSLEKHKTTIGKAVYMQQSIEAESAASVENLSF